MTTAYLLVTCCKDPSRTRVLVEVLRSLREQAPELREVLTVFDNASTEPGTIDLLRDCYTNIYQADRNVGYWSAIDWWLEHIASDPPKYTYIIESDMVHYNFEAVREAAKALDQHPELGSCRLHEYSIEEWWRYNKDLPRENSKRGLWQSHTNRVTNQPISHEPVAQHGLMPDFYQFWRTNFLTQLPALNRYETMRWCFQQLAVHEQFSELDFQRFYHLKYPVIMIHNGGAYNCDLNQHGTPGITGSWTDANTLKQLGYQTTRVASITPQSQYKVNKL